MEQKLGLIVGIIGVVLGLAVMIAGTVLMDMYRKENKDCKSCNKHGDEARFCSIEKGGCKK